MFSAFNKFGKLGSPAGGRSLTLAQQIAAMSPSLWLEPSVTGGYQDSAGTTALTQPGGGSADPPVGLVVDLSGNGRNASQATSTARPKLSARVNRLEHTEDFYGWYATEITVVNAAATAPNGTMTCSFLRDSASFSVHAVAFDLETTPKDAPVYASAYLAKFGLPNSKRYAYMSMVIGENTTTDYRYAVNLDLQTGTVTEAKTGAQVSGGVTTIVSDGSFWHVTLRAVPLTQSTSYTFMVVGNSNSATPVWNTYWDIEYAGDGVSGSYVWGTQWANAILPYQRVTDASNYDYSGFPLYWKFDKVDDRLLVTVPSGGWTGTMIHSTIAGTISYAATLPAGSFVIGTNGVDDYYTPDNRLVGQIFVNSALSDSDAGKVKDYFVSRGGGPKDAGAYAGVTDFSGAWAGCSSMTGPFPLIDTSSGTDFTGAWYLCTSMTGPFPLIDTSSGTNFAYAWAGCSSMTGPFPLIDTSSGTNFNGAWYLCSSMSGPFPLIDTSNGTNFAYAWTGCSSMTGPFPLIDTSSGTNFAYAWAECSSLTSFPANMFDTCQATEFTDAFVGCALNQTSIDNILVSIAAAGTSGGTLNMTGGTNATPSATGLAAKATLVGRGWTVTHN